MESSFSAPFAKFLELRKLTGSHLTLDLYSDDSGSISDGNGDVICGWNTDEEADEAIQAEIDAVKPAWEASICTTGCCFRLLNTKWGIEYVLKLDVPAFQRPIVKLFALRMAELLNERLPLVNLPYGTLVRAADDEITVNHGILVHDDGDDWPYKVCFHDEDDDPADSFFTKSQVKVHPDDSLIRGKVFGLCAEKKWNLEYLGQLQ